VLPYRNGTHRVLGVSLRCTRSGASGHRGLDDGLELAAKGENLCGIGEEGVRVAGSGSQAGQNGWIVGGAQRYRAAACVDFTPSLTENQPIFE
jgi:hypothetical protein